MSFDLSEKEIESLVREVDKNGKITLDLAQILKEAVKRRFAPPSDDDDDFFDADVEFIPISDDDGDSQSDGSTPEIRRKKSKHSSDSGESSSAEEEEEFFGRDYGVDGWGNPPLPTFTKNKMSKERAREIRTNPTEFIEFVYQNRRFKLKPIGTIEPVPKRIFFGNNGAPYYYKTRGPNGEKLSMGKQTRIYLKKYQKQQCFLGRSKRSRGLAGYIDINDACLNQPKNGRMKATRTSKTTKKEK